MIDAHLSRPTGYSGVCQTVISEVAATRGVPPEEIDLTLNEVIDPDALEKLFMGRDHRSGEVRGGVEFGFAGCRVMVRSTGDVSVSLLDETETVDDGHVGTAAGQESLP